MTRYQWLMITASFYLNIVHCQTTFGVPSQARVTRPAAEHLRDRNTYIIYYKNTTTEAEQQHFAAVLEAKSNTKKQFVVEIIKKFFIINCLAARLSKKALQWVKRQKIVLSVEKDEYFIVGSESTVNSSSPGVNLTWHLDKIGQVTLHNKTNHSSLTGKGIDVYILDSGIHYEHQEFDGRAHYPGYDPIDQLHGQKQAGRDCHGHGTHVAGLVGGKSTGVANGVTLFSVRILDCASEGTGASFLLGLDHAINHSKTRNATRAIINLSIAGVGSSRAINESLKLALRSGIIITASAGSGDEFRPLHYDSCKAYPANYLGIINVGSTDIHDNALLGKFDDKTYITNMGECVDVFAPGYKILSSSICRLMTCPVSNDAFKSLETGTSQSSAIVAGAVALLLEKCPALTYIEIKNLLRYRLYTSSVRFCKSFQYLKQKLTLLDVTATVIKTNNRLLYIGELSDMDLCNIFDRGSASGDMSTETK